jgi:hypothetical protein
LIDLQEYFRQTSGNGQMRYVEMSIWNLISCVLVVIALLSFMALPVAAVTSAVIGETVHLSGKGGGYDEMYLFLTGPNLAHGGVRLDRVSSPVASGTPSSFTRASVSDGVWEYDWNTGRTGGTLDAGTYLVWVSSQPLDRYDVLGTPYATIGVTLTHPGLTAEISGGNGNQDTEGEICVDAVKGPEDATEETPLDAATNLSGDDSTPQETSTDLTGAQGTPEDLAPVSTTVPTTVGSGLYPLVCAAGCGIVLLLYTGSKKKER